jgi:putative transposase
MARGGTSTDNPIIEAINGWVNEQLYLDFGLKDAEDAPALQNDYVEFFNNRRSAAARDYKSLVQYKTELGF